METDNRIAENTPENANEEIEEQILDNIRHYAHNKKGIPDRLDELDDEWDIERTLMLNAAVIALAGTVLAATVDKRYLAVPAVVTAFLAQHAIQGWCPPLPAFRALGIRSRKEIDSEKFALKALLGEFRVNQRTSELFEAVTE